VTISKKAEFGAHSFGSSALGFPLPRTSPMGYAKPYEERFIRIGQATSPSEAWRQVVSEIPALFEVRVRSRLQK
jgi:hypothetical protein